MKFEVGDVIQSKVGPYSKLKIVKIAEKGETVNGPWVNGEGKKRILAEVYILEDEYGIWTWSLLKYEEEYELVKEEDRLISEKKIRKFLQNEIDEVANGREDDETLGEGKQYLLGRQESLDRLYYELFGCYYS